MINSGKKEVLDILQNLRKEEIVELIKDIHQVVMIHYDNYCDVTGYMSFDQFYKYF